MSLQLHDRMKCKVEMEGKPEEMMGEVIWIHPQGRFARLEFAFESGYKIHQCYKMIDGVIAME